MGKKEEALKLMEDMEKRYSEGKITPDYFTNIAEGYLGIEKWDLVFEFLDRAYRDRNPTLLDFVRHPVYHDKLKSDPRYKEFLMKMGLANLLE